MKKTIARKFSPVKSPFGTGIDEQATIDAFKEFVGGNGRLESLARIARSSYPMPKGRFAFDGTYTSTEVFRLKAKKEGFTEAEVDGFLTFGSAGT